MPNQSHTTTSPQLPEWPVSRLVGRPHWQLAAGPGAGIGKARHETDHTQAQICLLHRMPNQLHTITSPQLPEWPASRSVGRPHWQLAAGPGAGIGKARDETDHKQAQICHLRRMPNQSHTITSPQLPEWPVSRLVGRPHWQLAAGPGAGIGKARDETDHTQAQICLLRRMPNQMHTITSPQLAEWPVSRSVGRPHWQLAAGPGAGSRQSASRNRPQTGANLSPVPYAQPVAHDHLFTAARVACVKVGWAPTLAAGRRPRRSD